MVYTFDKDNHQQSVHSFILHLNLAKVSEDFISFERHYQSRETLKVSVLVPYLTVLIFETFNVGKFLML